MSRRLGQIISAWGRIQRMICVECEDDSPHEGSIHSMICRDWEVYSPHEGSIHRISSEDCSSFSPQIHLVFKNQGVRYGCIMQAHSARHSESYMLPIQVASTPQSDQLLLDLRSRSFQEIQLFRLIFANDNVFFCKI